MRRTVFFLREFVEFFIEFFFDEISLGLFGEILLLVFLIKYRLFEIFMFFLNFRIMMR